jgi:phosphohistidine phosphatase
VGADSGRTIVKTLLLMRHAKSDWNADYGSDHERPLNGRGERSARLMGRLVKGMDLVPQHVVSSTAVRARTTARLASEAGGWGSSMVLEPDLYGTGPESVISIGAAAPDVERLMLVGHQPTCSMVVYRLTGARVDMRTASVAVIEVMAGQWSELPELAGVLAGLHHPRSFFGSEWDDVPGSGS